MPIHKKDWEKVTTLACNLANAAEEDNEKLSCRYRKRMHQLLDNLIEKYGELPSLLATKADYAENIREKLALLRKSYAIALKANDQANLTWVSSSIAEIYIDELKSLRSGRRWISLLEKHLQDYSDDEERKNFQRMQKQLWGMVKENGASSNQVGRSYRQTPSG